MLCLIYNILHERMLKMLELAHKLADSDTKFFGGWVLAGVEAHIHGQAVKLENRMLLEKERKCIIQVRGTTLADSVERLVKELRVFLVLPKNKLGTKTIEPETPTGKLLVEHVFTVQEVRDYVAYTGMKTSSIRVSTPLFRACAWRRGCSRLCKSKSWTGASAFLPRFIQGMS